MKIGIDKVYHLAFGLAIAVVASCLTAHASVGQPLPAILAGFFAATGLGLGKEYGDYAHGAGFDGLDLAATILGGLIGSMTGFAALAI